MDDHRQAVYPGETLAKMVEDAKDSDEVPADSISKVYQVAAARYLEDKDLEDNNE